MDFGFTIAAYAVAAVLFILSLGGLSGQESAKRAVWYGIAGMAIAVVATMIGPGAGLWQVSLILIAIGGAVGYQLATKVRMTQMPELVAIMHSLVGLAAVFVGLNAHIELGSVARTFAANGLPFPQPEGPLTTQAYGLINSLSNFGALLAKKTAVEVGILRVELLLGVWIGAVTFTGSVVAFAKLSGRVDGKPKKLPGGHLLNAGALAASVLFGAFYLAAIGPGMLWLLLIAVMALFIGYHLIM
ncbi:MAG: NAD(P)(+) transhydrogenase (Re/Si-specific) subunit beta, partial [Pararhodobacter sp.]